MKICSRCDIEKPFENFSLKGKGLNPICKQCDALYQKNFREDRNLKGLCSRAKCNNSVTVGGHLYCEYCKQLDKIRRHNRKKNGICHSCSNPVFREDGNACIFHVVDKLLRHSMGRSASKDETNLMLAKLQKDPYCPYTGEKLYLTKNTELDHKNPRATHIEDRANIENLQWVSKSANRAKADKTHEEFLNFCLHIVKHNNLC